MANFFIDRPIFAWVIAIMIMLGGALSITRLPVAQYPTIAPPTVTISASYPGASADTVEGSVTQVIEQAMQGLDGLTYISSTSDSNGSASITLTFSSSTNPDIAQVQVQNKLQVASASLPTLVQQLGVRVNKASSGFLMVVGFVSSDGARDATDLSDFVATNVLDPLARVNGVGSVQLFGSQYAMRIWLDPYKLYQFGLTTADVTSALQTQNTQVSAGQLGGLPAVPGQQLNATITVQSRLRTPEQFEGVFLKTLTNGSSVYLRDVASVEIGAESYATTSRFNRQPSAGVAVSLATGANALDVADAVKAQMTAMQQTFPPGISVVFPFDTTPFVRLSIWKVVETLIEAIGLVFFVMYLFLQNFRATLIPTLAVPVVLLGVFGVLAAFGYSINTLTMFAMVLAIGLLVDDAIVVVENVERVMHEDGLSPKEATRRSMGEITSALIGIAVVLAAVFVPMAFFGGSVGVIYRQFSVTIVAAMALSVLVALVFTPALTSTLLKPMAMKRTGFFGAFNRGFDKTNRTYARGVAALARRPFLAAIAYLAVIAGASAMFVRLPTSFLPQEDQGILFTQVALPAGATAERTLEALKAVENHYLDREKDNVDSMFAVSGFSFGGTGQNMGFAFIKLKDWDLRKRPDQSAQAIAMRAMGALSQVRDAMIFALAPPSVPGLGQSNGFDMFLKDSGGAGHEALMAARNQLLGMAAQDPKLAGVRPNGQEDGPQFQIDVDQAKAGALGLPLSVINATISTAWAGSYVNDFDDRGRVKKVYVQAAPQYRMLPKDVEHWYARNAGGAMAPLSAVASTRWTYGSPRIERYNGVRARNIQGGAAPGISSGVAMQEMEAIAQKLPPGFQIEWTGLSLQERQAGAQTTTLYAISALVVFLALAALYESWSVPFSVMLAVPLGLFGALASATFFGQLNDVYFQIGILTTIGLAAKNAILIVEFAKTRYDEGMSAGQAALHAAELRLRPILMTSLAFILGVLPMALARGAGAGAQNAIGIGVAGGMVAATTIGLFFVPVFFIFVTKTFGGRNREAKTIGHEARPAG
jgi:multidrug efflux pump